MNKYKVTYERQANTKYSFWDYAFEIIEARGLMHAQKLAHDHLKQMKKLEKGCAMRISKIRQVIEDAD